MQLPMVDEMQRKISPLHIVALFITSLIFIIGILIGWQMGYTAESKMKGELEGLRSEQYALDVLSLMRETGEAGCPALQNEFAELSTMTIEYGNSLDYMEKKLGKLDPEVMSLKSDYSLMQARNYLLLKDMDKNCGSSHIIILYFYTNEDYSASTDQGIALQDALAQLPAIREKTAIYHFDVNVNNPVMDAFKEQYGVTKVPTMIIKGKKYEGYVSAEKCREIFENA